ncbi:MAG: ATP-binding protein [Acidimicrobiales bacterium]
MTVAWAFPPDAASTRKARQRVADVLEASDLDAAAATASLVVSELATNAVLHAGTPYEVRVGVSKELVRIEVHDGVARPPVRRHFSDEATSGRGLRLVEELSVAWGVDVDEMGKTVWAEMSITAEPAVMAFDLDAVDEL